MLAWWEIAYGAVLSGVAAAILLALPLRERRAVVVTGALAALVGPLAWNAILRHTGGDFFVDAPGYIFPISLQDTGSGVFATALAALALGFGPLQRRERTAPRLRHARVRAGGAPRRHLPLLNADARRIVAAQAARAIAYGLGSVLIGVSLAERGLSGLQAGLVLAALLAGSALVSVVIGRYGDRFGRLRAYRLLFVAMAVAGTVFAVTGSLPALILAALTGTVSTEVVESGPFTSLEQAMLPDAAGGSDTTRLFGFYNTVAVLAGCGGALIVFVGSSAHWLLAYPVAAAAGLLATVRLSPAVEAKHVRDAELLPPLHASRSIVGRLSALFALDAFGGGFVPQTFIAYLFVRNYGASANAIAAVFFAVGILQAVSFQIAVRLAGRIGLLRTMVYPHFPSNVLLAAIAFAPNLGVAVALLLARSLLSQMDVPTRQAYVVAVVDPSERTAAAAYTNTARALSRPLAPLVAGVALNGLLGVPFVIAGALKCVYDVGLYVDFGRFRLVADLNVAVLVVELVVEPLCAEVVRGSLLGERHGQRRHLPRREPAGRLAADDEAVAGRTRVRHDERRGAAPHGRLRELNRQLAEGDGDRARAPVPAGGVDAKQDAGRARRVAARRGVGAVLADPREGDLERRRLAARDLAGLLAVDPEVARRARAVADVEVDRPDLDGLRAEGERGVGERDDHRRARGRRAAGDEGERRYGRCEDPHLAHASMVARLSRRRPPRGCGGRPPAARAPRRERSDATSSVGISGTSSTARTAARAMTRVLRMAKPRCLAALAKRSVRARSCHCDGASRTVSPAITTAFWSDASTPSVPRAQGERPARRVEVARLERGRDVVERAGRAPRRQARARAARGEPDCAARRRGRRGRPRRRAARRRTSSASTIPAPSRRAQPRRPPATSRTHWRRGGSSPPSRAGPRTRAAPRRARSRRSAGRRSRSRRPRRARSRRRAASACRARRRARSRPRSARKNALWWSSRSRAISQAIAAAAAVWRSVAAVGRSTRTRSSRWRASPPPTLSARR